MPNTQVQIAAHPSRWYDIFTAILRAIEQGNAPLAGASIIPAPIEQGITIGIIAAATAGAVIKQTQDASLNQGAVQQGPQTQGTSEESIP